MNPHSPARIKKPGQQNKKLSALEAAENLAKNNIYFADLVEGISVGIMVFDLLKERIVAMNRTAENYFKHSVKPKDYQAFYNMFFKSNGESQLNIHWYLPRAQVLQYGSRHFGYTIHPMAGGYMGLFVQDITQKIRSREIAASQHMLEIVDNVFVGVNAAFQKPMQEIRDILTSLRESVSPEATANGQAIDSALSRLSGMEELLGTLQDFDTFHQVSIQTIEMGYYLQRFVAMLNNFLERRAISLQTVFPDDAIFAPIHPELFKRALFNVVANAIEAVENNAEPLISMSCYQNAERIIITVEDNGHGVPPLLEDKLFYPFYTSKLGATGLGLTIAKKIITAMSGRINVTGVRGIGTVVEFNLPVERQIRSDSR